MVQVLQALVAVEAGLAHCDEVEAAACPRQWLQHEEVVVALQRRLVTVEVVAACHHHHLQQAEEEEEAQDS